MITLVQHRAALTVHELATSGRAGATLLLLHGLGSRSPRRVPAELAGWAGPILALDFSGHGQSDAPVGGGYTSEALLADVDAVCDRLGPVVLHGSGLGAWVAVLFAGIRPELVDAVILADGPGLAGGGPRAEAAAVTIGGGARPDPLAVAELAAERRDPEYLLSYAWRYHLGRPSGVPTSLMVTALARPPWLATLLDSGLAAPMSLDGALIEAATASAAAEDREGKQHA